MANNLPILIAGGGIGGLAAALALSQKGFATHVLEQAPEFAEIGAGIQLGPNANRTLETLGLSAAMSKHVVAVDELRLMDSLSDRHVASIPLGETIKKRFGAPYFVIHRADLHNELYKACSARKNITLETDCTAIDFKETDKSVSVILKDGRKIEGSGLIGADGLWSKIRGKLLDDGPPRFAKHTCYRTLLDPEEMPKDLRWNAATLWAGPNTHLVHYPIKAGKKYNIVATFASGSYQEGWNIEGDKDELLFHFRKLKPRPKQILDISQNWRKWSLCDRDPVKIWSRGRVSLLGDAAHPMLQYFAQGAAMAIEDAVDLAAKLDGTKGDIEKAFDLYQRSRADRAGRVQLEARRLGKLYHAKGWQRWLRNWYLRRTPPEKITEGLDWLYSGS